LYDFESCIKIDSSFNIGMNCFDKLKEDIELGRKDFFEYCGLKGDKLPKCDVKEVYVLDGGVKTLLRVYGIVGKVRESD